MEPAGAERHRRSPAGVSFREKANLSCSNHGIGNPRHATSCHCSLLESPPFQRRQLIKVYPHTAPLSEAVNSVSTVAYNGNDRFAKQAHTQLRRRAIGATCCQCPAPGRWRTCCSAAVPRRTWGGMWNLCPAVQMGRRRLLLLRLGWLVNRPSRNLGSNHYSNQTETK
jgi:hypothetical protein